MAYSKEVRRKARQLYYSGLAANEIAERMGINPDTIYRWKKQERWDDEISDESIEAIKRQINAILSLQEEGEELSDAQLRKLDRLTKALKRLERHTRVKGRKKKPRSLSVQVIGSLRDKALDMLYPYQRRFVEDNSRFRIVLKSRQIGFTFTIALEAVLSAIERKEDQIVVSASQMQSDIVRRYAVKHMESLGIEYMEDRNSLILPGGKRIFFLPSNPRTVQGYTGDVYLDEFAWHLKSHLMWQAVVPSITVGKKRLTVLSTPYTTYDKFGEIWNNPDKYPRFSRYKITIYDAVRDGLNVDIEELKSLFDEQTWRQAYECEFFSDETALLTYHEVKDAIADTLIWTDAPVLGGMDVGRYRDLTAVSLVEEDREGIVWTRHIQTIEGQSLARQKEVVLLLFEQWNISLFSIDATGIGQGLYDELATILGHKIERVWFTREKKEEMALTLKRLFSERKIKIPNDRDLIMQLHAIKRKPTQTGFTYDAERNEMIKHADLFWALALAVKNTSAGKPRLITGVW